MRTALTVLALLLPAAVLAETQPIEIPTETRLPSSDGSQAEPNLDSPEPDLTGEELPVITVAPKETVEDNALLFENLRRDPVVFALVAEKPGLSFHRPMFLLPVSWVDGLADGEQEAETYFQISFKQRIFNSNFYFAYSQKSFWQVFDSDRSRPFRETNYNPEVFYRWKPNDRPKTWGLDLGAEHESNGKEIPDSRSWNRIYAGGFWENPNTLVYLKLWYRLPEDDDRPIDDPKRDDNPNIENYYGYGELQVQRNLFGARRHRIGMLGRFNPDTGRGAINLSYSAPLSNYAFWNFYVWQGYGESLIDYNREVTRVGLGVSFSR
jgi:phospholipase A1